MKVIIAGSRTIEDYFEVDKAIGKSGFKITEIVCGEARGPDTDGKTWGFNHGVPVKSFYPAWKSLGKAAGIVRNKQMGDYADALIAIWDGKSRGTKQMIEYMQGLNKPTYVHVVKS